MTAVSFEVRRLFFVEDILKFGAVLKVNQNVQPIAMVAVVRSQPLL